MQAPRRAGSTKQATACWSLATIRQGPARRDWLAVGDSYTAGTGDHSGGWIRRTHAALATQGAIHDLEVVAVPGATIREVHDGQAQQGDRRFIVSAVAGANDLLRPHFDLEMTVTLTEALLTWAQARAEIVVTSTCPDFAVPRRRAAARIRRRVDLLNDWLRAWAAEQPNVIVVDAFALLDVPELWAPDRIHPSPAGHAALAVDATEALRSFISGR